jgi:hypothetical protein
MTRLRAIGGGDHPGACDIAWSEEWREQKEMSAHWFLKINV